MPSEQVLAQKQLIVDSLTDQLRSAVAGVLVDYRGLTVAQDTDLRNKLRAAGVEYKVVKNTLTRFAANKIGYESLDPILNGPTSLALHFSDPVAAAKVLVEFSKKNDKLEIKAGFVDGKVIGIEQVKALAELPSKEVLIARVLGGFNAPISGFVGVLSGTLRSLVYTLNAIADKKSA